MGKLTENELVGLAERIADWILTDDSLLWSVALEQAGGWTRREYEELLASEGK